MFTYEQIEHLLSKSAKTILKDPEAFNMINETVASLIENITEYSRAELINLQWIKTPYIMLVEYFVYNRIDALNEDSINKAENFYDNAMKILESKTKSIMIGKSGTIKGLYDEEL